MSGVNELMLRFAGIVFEPCATLDVVEVVVVVAVDPQLAATRATPPARLSQPARRKP
jgi:hypothetical protein